MIIGGSASQSLASQVAIELNDKLCSLETKKFPDGERYLRIKEDIPEDEKVIIVQSTGYPQDENMMELFFILDTLSDMNITDITVVSPYLGYSRQERRFKEVECIGRLSTDFSFVLILMISSVLSKAPFPTDET